MAGLAVGHAEVRGDTLIVVVTLHAVHHLGKRQVGQAGARGHGVVARRAIQVELLPGPEMSDMTEFQIDSNAGNHMRRNQAAVFGKSGVLNFLRGVASTAIGSGGISAERGLHSSLRMAHSALGVARERSKNPLRIKLMAEGAIRPEAGFGVDPPLGIDMAGVGELEQDRALFFVARERE